MHSCGSTDHFQSSVAIVFVPARTLIALQEGRIEPGRAGPVEGAESRVRPLDGVRRLCRPPVETSARGMVH